MEWTQALAVALVGGLLGALLGVWASFRIDRAQRERRAKAAGRAVALELMVNCDYLEAALSGAPLEELHRSLFDRELNELALLLGPPDFRVASIPYIKWSAWEARMSRIRLRPVASYEPDEPALLEEVLTDMRAASDVVAAKVWTAREREAMAHLNEPHHPHVH